MAYKKLFTYIGQHISLTEEDKEQIKSSTRIKKVRKHQFVAEQGEVCRYESFVVEGCLRCYHTDEEGKEHVVQFAIEDWWIADLQSFLSQTPANFSVDALEPSVLIQFEHEDLQALYRKIPKLERFFRLIIQKAFIASQNRVVASYSQDAGKRYIEFRNRYPTIEQRVPQYMIASYLGITPEFLSKIRSRFGED
ncbi:Crp/Fnr family transcriptional regulator [Gracilimonas mengyeensis]|uniref:cAMP-binding domain of CRP or a regulatory subunit of cAMP-dependent protein kinases n=1 Tax=Gracilimonas mengyeensis TaxID=1302730 RepID=A0A521DRP4_9BACT|nr:Crp/Fnr family transcriptional regulator [Gracilimonas mengyeensis]SMO74376.1 cAMP-binding domain of CRP or a regulatory subunit of cAMP-dependent protein kinases [Gracilimonas mengyeensis]